MNFGKIKNCEFAAIDFETIDSIHGKNDAPVQLGIAIMKFQADSFVINKEKLFRSYINPEMELARRQNKYYRIDAKSWRDSPTLLELWPDINERLRGRVCVAHAAAMEKRILRKFPLHNFKPWLDTLQIFQAALPKAKQVDEIENHRLGNLIKLMPATYADKLSELCPNLTWHDALYDATACLLLLAWLFEKKNLLQKEVTLLKNPKLSNYYRLKH